MNRLLNISLLSRISLIFTGLYCLYNFGETPERFIPSSSTAISTENSASTNPRDISYPTKPGAEDNRSPQQYYIQAWFFINFLVGIAASSVHGSNDANLYFYPLLYSKWVISGIGLPFLVAQFLTSYGLHGFAWTFLVGISPPLLFYQAPKYYRFVDQYNDAVVVASLYTLALLCIFVGNGSLLLATLLLAIAIIGVDSHSFPQDTKHFLALNAANFLLLRAMNHAS